MALATTCTSAGDADTAYATLAPYYDAFTDHPSYAGWVLRLEALARRHGLSGRRALDVGCGTGKSTTPLLELGYEVTGCDPTPAMLACARRKLGACVRLVRADVAQLPALGRFDYVSCLNDVLNYLLELDDLASAFGAIEANMAPGGVLLFDLSTTAMYRTHFRQVQWREAGGHAFVIHGDMTEDFGAGDVVDAAIEVFARDGDRFRRVTSRHRQRHHPHDDVVAALETAGLDLRAVYGQWDDGHPEQPLEADSHTKAIYVVRKPL